MDVKAPATAVPPALLAPYARPVPIPQRPTPCAGPVAPEDVVDCIDIRGGAPASPGRGVPFRGNAEKSPPAKGSLIDIRI